MFSGITVLFPMGCIDILLLFILYRGFIGTRRSLGAVLFGVGSILNSLGQTDNITVNFESRNKTRQKRRIKCPNKRFKQIKCLKKPSLFCVHQMFDRTYFDLHQIITLNCVVQQISYYP